MQRFLQTLLCSLPLLVLISCSKDNEPLSIQQINTSNNTTTTTAVKPDISTQYVKSDGYISAIVNNKMVTYNQHTLDCKGQASNVDNSLMTFSDGSKQLEMIRNATTIASSDRFEITAGDNIDKMSVPFTFKTGSLSWSHSDANSNMTVYRALLGSGEVTITVTSKTADHLKGTFSGVLHADNVSEANGVQVQNGSFDIQLARINE